RDGAVPAEQARELFKTICTADAAPEPPVAAVMEEFYTQLLLEMQRSIDGFIALYPGGEVKRIYVCGGGSALPNLASHLSKNLGIATDLFNPFQRIVDPEGKAPAVPALYAVAVGLAMPPRRKGKG
ncbi:MAG: pilus assembly protein PilM, partial [Deltaproteobacteria bacterium]|nr:pilus assembly protein PilM [Deltaproteobacteria bacterium]